MSNEYNFRVTWIQQYLKNEPLIGTYINNGNIGEHYSVSLILL